ncbi:hypothetical protein A3F34_02150 [Candidatus Roizmanbacteria bacterium RIFCSPHIGHO2_12_FULL_44_10]|uniref:Uncharacterized protein n=1 Tax=Candidatus Roizmanbacteria bacterium RIFCSPHIGHO2_12_FULL_44_10 TaxID=1802054 RepID=A0A1F7I6I5_9BACT|nr:MAG: hypothetical protein A3F34_02150 [Candidatus Roizmanbacteria bacterium RIFCSPHIGHO2_12_FULL_44_10]
MTTQVLNDEQTRLLAESLSNIGLAFFATMIMPELFIKRDLDFSRLLGGTILALLAYIISLLLLRYENSD